MILGEVDPSFDQRDRRIPRKREVPVAKTDNDASHVSVIFVPHVVLPRKKRTCLVEDTRESLCGQLQLRDAEDLSFHTEC
jgi:hypothetical protein